MADEVTTESAPVESQPVAPEAAPDTGIFPVESAPAEPEREESAPSTEKPAPDSGETAAAPDAANQERLDSEKRASETAKRLSIENREIKRQLRQFQQQMEQSQQPRALLAPVKPKLEDYDDAAKFDADIEAWKEADRKFVIQQYERERVAKEQQAQQTKQMEELRSDWEKRSQRLVKQNPGFNVVEALQRVEPSPTMDGFFVDSPVGPELLNYFDENPEAADKIRELPPFKAVRELVRLEEELSNQVKGIKGKPSVVKPVAASTGRASAPAAPRTAADVLYG